MSSISSGTPFQNHVFHVLGKDLVIVCSLSRIVYFMEVLYSGGSESRSKRNETTKMKIICVSI